ncbi:helicase-related protein [Bacillus smithii]|uniref:Helicase C-terminal domain-containing protein n=1 Tax=Bacillus smithii 7_3_47FAA TaxID=665952 RepID=G9QHK6_9BACI|nr:helicase-related protein [Bacillus smithii]EHL79384.1 hypothetical protein HMPREF1015_01265 [Bacillus smithii 7_3_47FAA]
MSISIEQSLINRQKVIDRVKEEIVGPGAIRSNYKKFRNNGSTIFQSEKDLRTPYYWEYAGQKEEILQRQSPLERYASGILHPLGVQEESPLETMIEKESIDEEDKDIEKLFAPETIIEGVEDEGDIELLPQNSEYKLSTMGLTFCIEKNVPYLNVIITGGNYKAHNVYIKDRKDPYTWWLRKSTKGTYKLSIEDLYKNKHLDQEIKMTDLKGEPLPQYNIHIQTRLREINDKYVITISATNYSNNKVENDNENAYFRKIECMLFQTEIRIETPSGFYFSSYPKPHEIKKRKLNEDEGSMELLYRNEKVYAFGHGCAVQWDQYEKRIQSLITTFLPEYEMKSMSPDVKVRLDGKEIELIIKMSDLAGISTQDHPRKILAPLIEGYKNWIIEKCQEISSLESALQPAARKHMNLCQKSLDRMIRGLELLDDPQVLKAFQLANKAILLQQLNGTEKRDGYVTNGKIVFDKVINKKIQEDSYLKNADNKWRAFQIAFFLLSIESFVTETSDDREIVDLIWFPTGGGKTEAYLGVAAFQMILRRLRNPNDTGVDVIMRYTLRLLTADQFQRASRLICSLEFIRMQQPELLGETPFSIGIWVGSKTTPNNNKVAIEMWNKLSKNKKNAPNFIVTNCPWCGAKLGHYKKDVQKKGNDVAFYGYKIVKGRLIAHCPDSNCQFHEELPVYFVDETIYEKRPTFLIGTIDKFVQLVWRPEARSLFGIDKNGNHFVSPPSLIIQDELHLISGPLGTLAGLFEILVEELCLKQVGNEVVKPKIIAATATIKQFEEQARALFGRKDARLFPSSGLDHEDSFFAKTALDIHGKPMPGRKYVGVYTTSFRIMMAQVMAFSAILQSMQDIKEDERDPYWTLLAFYNTLRELGGGLTLAQTDIPYYSKAIAMRTGTLNNMRFVNKVLQLSSSKQSHEIAQSIDDLKTIYSAEKNRAIDLCLASSIIEVGVDIDRLSVMAIVGQPKLTAQYIQVSGRVGRRWWERPGVIFTVYSNTKSRDKSHFEHFMEYHQKLYAQVESTSVTPFSDSSLDRGLHAVIVGYIRQALNETLAHTPDSNEINRHLKSHIFPFIERIVERAKLVDKEQLEELRKRTVNILNQLRKNRYTTWEVDENKNIDGYMYQAGSNPSMLIQNGSVSMINSMRNVDLECRGQITDIYVNNNKSDEDIDFENELKGLFS